MDDNFYILWNPHNENLPINDLFVLSSDEELLLGGDDAQRVLLARLRLGVDHICTEVHVHSALRQRARLKVDKNTTCNY